MKKVSNIKTPDVVTIDLGNNDLALQISGPGEKYLKLLANAIPVNLKGRGSEITIEGDPEQIEQTTKCLNFLKELASKGRNIAESDIRDSVRVCQQDQTADLKSILLKEPIISAKKKIYPRTLGQKKYVDAIKKFDLVFGVGPAGTGKTYLAMAVGIDKLIKGNIDRIILTRPAVEAGEKLGFLPGNLSEKVDPYLRPMMDALHEMVEYERAEKYVASGQIEIAPIAFMRGRTLNDSYVILDEAQNCTREQMKMFLTRIGENSTAVVTGDITQIDLPRDSKSGLIQVLRLLNNIDEISIHQFDTSDVVRHPLVAKIIGAYERDKIIP
ncbi:hypothetical protein BVY03_03545 [bacterium K02(2017)]|nr:hypothetical protein BVY03_03545 [bacterium K02(2017)]